MNRVTASGLAVQPTQLLPSDINVALNYDELSLLWAARHPCANCTFLIESKLKMTLANFRKPLIPL